MFKEHDTSIHYTSRARHRKNAHTHSIINEDAGPILPIPRDIFRTAAGVLAQRLERDSYPDRCCNACQLKKEQEQERHDDLLKEKEGAGVRYMVNGHPMTVYQAGLYWLGRRYEHSRAITKSFGTVDPRPGLEEVID